jgi:hypothetical protein
MLETTKKISTRIISKHDSEANWLANPEFIPYNGEQIFYDSDVSHKAARLKVGDGITKISELPFVGVDIIDVTELPNPNISAKFVINRAEAHSDTGFVCFVVDSLPETGKVVSDSELTSITAYYNKADNEAYGYVDRALGAQFGV